MLAIRSLAAALLPLLLLPQASNALEWGLSTNASGEAFLDLFTFSDGTQVAASASNWTLEDDARSMGLVSVDKSTSMTRLKTDSTNKYPDGKRPTLRLESKDDYGDGVIILQVGHFPNGCATWPAWWARPRSEAYEEIDIWENTNTLFPRGASIIHTRSTCNLPNATQTGLLETDSCSTTADNTDGCRVDLQPYASKDATEAGAGRTIAMERSFGSNGTGIRVWSWPSGEEPSDVDLSADSVDTDGWGTPSAHFPIQECTDSAFKVPHMLVLDTSLCGKWTNTTYPEADCASQAATCVDLVMNHPSAFSQSYWDIASLRIYSDLKASSAKKEASTASSSSTSKLTVSAARSLPKAQLATVTAAVVAICSLALFSAV